MAAIVRPFCEATFGRNPDAVRLAGGGQVLGRVESPLSRNQGRVYVLQKWSREFEQAHETVSVARSGIGCYLGFYNSRKPHRALDGITPDAIISRIWAR